MELSSASSRVSSPHGYRPEVVGRGRHINTFSQGWFFNNSDVDMHARNDGEAWNNFGHPLDLNLFGTCGTGSAGDEITVKSKAGSQAQSHQNYR
ncbi:hypothetical protein PoB_002370700 [Plakobranchus ocellatus]|uniref:Uncharacterized protein n=1 Tax=Plakobranchus ocellatus TaxID=259542 RepID=A0AAV3ZPS6_9GAST|nr:hypothetical protein PoB_002370700 [Plakobranchus ocellatus]